MNRIFTIAVLLGGIVVTANAQDAGDKKNSKDKKDAQAAAAVDTEKTTVKKVIAPQIEVKLRDTTKFMGAAADIEEIKLETVFGEVELPLSTIAGVRFATDDAERTTVVLLNGDSLTGVVLVEEFKLTTTWGQATVQTHSIQSITMVPDMTWASESAPGGIRWKLSNAHSHPITPLNSSSSSSRPSSSSPASSAPRIGPPIFRSN